MKTKNIYSIRRRIALTLTALIVLQIMVFVLVIIFSGTIQKIDIAAYDNLSADATGQKDKLQSLMSDKMDNAINETLTINRILNSISAKHGISPKELPNDQDALEEAFSSTFSSLVNYSRYTSVTGMFVILDNPTGTIEQSQSLNSAIYIKDDSPGVVIEDNTNLSLLYGPSTLAQQANVQLHENWKNEFQFQDLQSNQYHFFTNPMQSKGSMAALDTLGYWSAPISFTHQPEALITYTLPLLDDKGSPYGIFGIEISASFLSSMLPTSGHPFESGFYLLSMSQNQTILSRNTIGSGRSANAFLAGKKSAITYQPIKNTANHSTHYIYIESNPKFKVIGSLQPLNFYPDSSPYKNEVWTLTCAAPCEAVYSNSSDIRSALSISIGIALVSGLLLSISFSKYLSYPITSLASYIRLIDPSKPVRFTKTNMREINALSSAFEQLSDDVAAVGTRMFHIITLVDISMGVFELDHQNQIAVLSGSMFSMTQIQRFEDHSQMIPMHQWNLFIQSLGEPMESRVFDGITETLYCYGRPTQIRWLRMRSMKDSSVSSDIRTIGTLMDVTEEVLQKQHLEFQRNHDSLTQLLNRSAFIAKSYELIEQAKDKVGIMLFCDLDNLKFMNDTYGHDFGDKYIQKFAECLSVFKECNGATSRISGDEFIIYLHGFNTKLEAKQKFETLYETVKNTRIISHDNNVHKIRVSIGLAYYPDDSTSVEQLLKYSDYAMYEIKRTIKGSTHEFSKASYEQNAHIILHHDIFNLFIEEERVRFAFQPIVDVTNGEVYAYEALMRPTMREFKSPAEVLQIARSQSKLYLVEKLTYNLVLKWISIHRHLLNGKKIFMNSIPNQAFVAEDLLALEQQYSDLFQNVVLEITENEYASKDSLNAKIEFMQKWGGQIAIDDYGSGYSNELTLLSINPDFIKIDMCLIRDIDKDKDRQQLLQNIISYSTRRGIKTLAEGIETYAEMKTLISFGINYLQGYYLAKPQFELKDIEPKIKIELIELHHQGIIHSQLDD